MFDLESKIETLLFWKGEPIAVKELAKSLNVSAEDTNAALSSLEEKLKGRGLVLVRKDEEVSLGTAPEMSDVIESFVKEEMARDIGRAGLETLSIILYYGPISRRDVDYIRGVNSAFIVKSLLIRGLIERTQDKKDMRSFLYKPAMDLLRFLGIPKVENLPEYEKTREELKIFKDAVQAEIDNENSKERNEEGPTSPTENNGGQETITTE